MLADAARFVFHRRRYVVEIAYRVVDKGLVPFDRGLVVRGHSHQLLKSPLPQWVIKDESAACGAMAARV